MQDIATVHKANNCIHTSTGIFDGSLVSQGMQSVCSHSFTYLWFLCIRHTKI